MKHVYVPVPGVTLESMKGTPRRQLKISGACDRGDHHRCYSKPENCHCPCGHVFPLAKNRPAF